MELGTGNKAQGFQGLDAWARADDLASVVFAITENELAPRHRWLGLQIVRAAFSVPANIAEGYGRSSLGDYIRFLEIAGASLNEVENALHFMKRNGVLPAQSITEAEDLRRTTGNLLFGLLKSLRAKQKAAGEWQRGMIKEPTAEYGAGAWEESMFQVPGSQFPDREV